MITVIHFNTGKVITTYDTDYQLDCVQHDIEGNGYDWVTMHNIKGEITITVIEKI